MNPAHMRLVTRAGNALAGNSPHSDNARKTHCKRGHALEGDNLRIVQRKGRAPSRECVTCRRQRNRDSYQRNDHKTKQRDWYAARKQRAQEDASPGE
ncbi:hypothetical protein ACWCQE_26640 [Streptomyces sp. NPDC002409]